MDSTEAPNLGGCGGEQRLKGLRKQLQYAWLNLRPKGSEAVGMAALCGVLVVAVGVWITTGPPGPVLRELNQFQAYSVLMLVPANFDAAEVLDAVAAVRQAEPHAPLAVTTGSAGPQSFWSRQFELRDLLDNPRLELSPDWTGNPAFVFSHVVPQDVIPLLQSPYVLFVSWSRDATVGSVSRPWGSELLAVIEAADLEAGVDLIVGGSVGSATPEAEASHIEVYRDWTLRILRPGPGRATSPNYFGPLLLTHRSVLLQHGGSWSGLDARPEFAHLELMLNLARPESRVYGAYCPGVVLEAGGKGLLASLESEALASELEAAYDIKAVEWDSGAVSLRGCTQATPRCSGWVEAGKFTPPCDIHHLEAMLVVFAGVMERAGLEWWLDFGTLLASLRHNGELIPTDTDVDVSIHQKDWKTVAAALKTDPAVAEAGMSPCPSHHKSLVRLCYSKINTIHMDIWPWYEDAIGGVPSLVSENHPHTNTAATDNPWNANHWHWPKTYIEPLGTCPMFGEYYPCPNNPVSLLKFKYGPDVMTTHVNKFTGEAKPIVAS